MARFADHFSQLAERYAQYRPHYPPALAAALAERCAQRDTAWDVGCGSGQLSVSLADHFARVLATDPAEAQIAQAQPAPRVEYRVAPAEASGLPDASVDLAVAAQAAHWFDWPRFVTELGRVVRPGGLVALVTYHNAEVEGPAGARLDQFYAAIAPYWPNGRHHVNTRYRDLVLPWPAVPAPEIEMSAQWTRDELAGYATTWSATARYVAANGDAAVTELSRDLAALWPDGEARTVRWPLTVILARR